MEWIRISESKLKIMLSAEDAKRYALDCNTADFADDATRTVFREILTEVRSETGFDATEDKVYIQMYPSKSGGCELFVTKMGLLLSNGQTDDRSPVKRASTARPLLAPRREARQRQCAFVFGELEHLLALCRRMSALYTGESQIWKSERGSWWLILCDGGDPFSLREDFRFAREYGTQANADEVRAYLSEHGTCLCAKNGIAVFARL